MSTPYDITDYPPFAVTTDLVVLRIRAAQLCVLVVKRGADPFRGNWALPGGFVHRGPAKSPESLDEAAARELREETGLGLKRAPYVAQLGAYGDPGRDPRGDVVTVAYLVAAAADPKLHAGGDAAAAGWLPVFRIEQGYDLAFDHTRIVRDGVERVRDLIQFTALATAFCGPRFSVANLRRAYEIIWGGAAEGSLDPGNFQHRIGKMEGLLAEARIQVPPSGFEKLGLGPRPRSTLTGPGRAAARRAVDDDAVDVSAAPDGVFTLAGERSASLEELASLTSSGGPKPTLYEPGPLIRRQGFTAPLERPILNHAGAPSAPGLSGKRRPGVKPS